MKSFKIQAYINSIIVIYDDIIFTQFTHKYAL